MLREVARDMGITSPAILEKLEKVDSLSQGQLTALGLDARPIIAAVAVLVDKPIAPPPPPPPKPPRVRKPRTSKDKGRGRGRGKRGRG